MSCWSCTVDTCSNQALLLYGDCEACSGHFCSNHVADKTLHPCMAVSDPATILKQCMDNTARARQQGIDEIDCKAIRAAARRLRPGHTCTNPKPKRFGTITKNTFGDMRNIQYVLTFDDGVKWVVRHRIKKFNDRAPEAINMGLRSEAATFQSLHEAGVTVPSVHLPEQGTTHQQGKQDYFFVDFIPGKEHRVLMCREHMKPFPDPIPFEAFIKIAQWYMSLEKVTYDKCGSLTYDVDGNIIVGPIISSFPIQGVAPYYLGPYDSPWQRKLAWFDMMMKLTLNGQLCTPLKQLGCYLQLLEAKTLVERCEELRDDKGPWYMLHGDPKSDIFMFTEGGEISGVLDWEYSWTTSKAMAFASPFPPLPTVDGNELLPFEIALRDAYIHLGRLDLAQMIEDGKKYQRLNAKVWGVVKDVIELNLLRQAFGQPSLKPDGCWPADMKEWKKCAENAYIKDPGVKRLRKERRVRADATKTMKQVSNDLEALP